jgi:hypothetical protein
MHMRLAQVAKTGAHGRPVRLSRIVTSIAVAAAATTFFATEARADIATDEMVACRSKNAGDACALPSGATGVCSEHFNQMKKINFIQCDPGKLIPKLSSSASASPSASSAPSALPSASVAPSPDAAPSSTSTASSAPSAAPSAAKSAAPAPSSSSAPGGGGLCSLGEPGGLGSGLAVVLGGAAVAALVGRRRRR